MTRGLTILSIAAVLTLTSVAMASQRPANPHSRNINPFRHQAIQAEKPYALTGQAQATAYEWKAEHRLVGPRHQQRTVFVRVPAE